MTEEKKQEQEQKPQNQSGDINLTKDVVEKWLETEEGKRFIQPKLDSYFTKGLETWKNKTLPKIIEEEINKRFPPETEEQKRLRKLEEELRQEREQRLRETLKNKMIEKLTKNNMPIELVDFIVGSDEDTTEANYNRLKNIWENITKKYIEEKFKNEGREPHKGVKTPDDIDTLISKAEAEGNIKEAIRLKNQKLLFKR